MDILFLSKRIFLGDSDEFIHGGIVVTNDGKVRQILRSAEQVNSYIYNTEAEQIIDFEDKVLMPGLIDSHVHINEPGRKDWEGFLTATKAAAAGGFTTIVDMPLNSIPPTTSVENLKTKTSVARGKLYIDVAFWGGIVPDNIDQLEPMLRSGVVGLKCFLGPSGVPEFPPISVEQLKRVMKKIENSGTVLAVHGEISPLKPIIPDESQPKKYDTFLKTRPSSMEVDAVEVISPLAQCYKIHMHLVNLSSADCIPIIQKCKKNGGNLTVETCHHYLSLAAEDVPDAHTEYRCCPPIREKSNQNILWKAILNNDIDLVVSDHSPATPGIKCLTYGKGRGDFIKAGGGISSLQFGLPLFWTNCLKYGLKMTDVYRLMCANPAKLCGIDNQKGKIEEGYDADFCIWDPDEEFTITSDIIYFQNKANPYMDQKLRGAVYATVLRGLHVFQRYEGFGQPLGKVLLKKSSKKIVKFNKD